MRLETLLDEPAGFTERSRSENPIGSSDGSFGFLLKPVARNRKYRWTSQRDLACSEKPKVPLDKPAGFSL